MQELYGKFELFWIIHGGELFSRKVTGIALCPGGSQQHLAYLWLGEQYFQWPMLRLAQ